MEKLFGPHDVISHTEIVATLAMPAVSAVAFIWMAHAGPDCGADAAARCGAVITPRDRGSGYVVRPYHPRSDRWRRGDGFQGSESSATTSG
jgi:hypothetical protein